MSEYDIAKSDPQSSYSSTMISSRTNNASGQQTTSSPENDQTRFLNMKLAPTISKLNIITFFLLQYINFCGLNMALSFLSFILRDPKYYNVSKDDVGTVNSQISLYAEIVLIIIGFFIGPIFDLVGRKKFIIFGQIISGLAFVGFP